MIFLGFIGGQVLGAAWAAIIGVIIAALGGMDLSNTEAVGALKKMIAAPSMITGFIAGGIAMIFLSFHFAGDRLRDGSPTGAAWRVGSLKQLLEGILSGSLIAFSCLLLFSLVFPASPESRKIGPVAEMAMTGGITRMLWLFLALILAPPVEELLFRGVLLGGFRSSFGPVGSATAVTLLFVLLHLTEVVYYWPALIGIFSLAVVTLWLRLRSGTIGPAIAAHFCYNAFIAMAVIKLYPR